MDAIPIWLFFAATILIITLFVEVGYRLGDSAHRRSEDEKESPVSAISGSVLALLAFVMAFTFAIVSDRYDARKGLVREEANALRTAYLRADFLPEPDRNEAKAMLREYVGLRAGVTQAEDLEQVRQSVVQTSEIQRQLWDMAVENARKDMNSDVAALYIESLNDIVGIQALRVAVGLQARIPAAIWAALFVLVGLGMLAVGYQTAIAGSRRSWAAVILAVSFSLVIVLIALLDRPQSRFLAVSQQPLVDLQAVLTTDAEAD